MAKVIQKEGGGFGFEVQFSITEKGRYAVAYGLSCKKDCHGPTHNRPKTNDHIRYLSRHCTVTEIAKQLNRHLRQDKSNGGTLRQHLRICSKAYRKRYGSTRTGGKVPDRAGIENRPAVVGQKSRIGDWEADTIE